MISVKRLKIGDGKKDIVDISFDIDHSLALVGESGSGKSLTLKALLSMLPSNLEVDIEVDAPFLLERGKSLSFVPQNPFTALSPMTRISDQWFDSRERAEELFSTLGLEMELFFRYPPQLSGGQLQRVIFAMAVANSPKLILLDEPTTALDPELREEMVDILLQLQEKFAFKTLFVTHDIRIAARICRECFVIKDGREIERGPSDSVLGNPRREYTKRLIDAGFSFREFRK